MLTQLLNLECYTPDYIGRKHILIANDKIFKILDADEPYERCGYIKEIDCSGLMAFPGIIDGHVHIIGGGGEGGYTSRLGEITLEEIISGGVTTVIGLLGTDNRTKSLVALLAKARALEEQGITAFIYSGSYEVPIVTLTGDITQDMVLIDKVIGAGEIAVSDHRSTVCSMEEIAKLASKTHIGGMLSGKAGIVHFHMGDGQQGLNPVTELLNITDLPKEMLLPTHVNRNPTLFEQAKAYAKAGGFIDLTSAENVGISVPEGVKALLDYGVNVENITISSDGNGSCPHGGFCQIGSLLKDAVSCITEKGLSPEIVFKLISQNPAKRIKQYPKKGTLAEGSDADILITDNSYRIIKLISMGKLLMDNGIKFSS